MSLRENVNASSVICRVKCLAILNLLITLPTRSAIMSCPRSGRLSRRVAAPRVHMLPNPFHHNSRSLFSFVGNSVRLGFHLAS